MYGKILISLLVCLAIVLSTVKSSKHNEVSAVTSLTQPISIMYSLLTQKDYNQMNEMNGLLAHKYRSLQQLKKKMAAEKDQQIRDKDDTKEEPEKDAVTDTQPAKETPKPNKANTVKRENDVQSTQKVIYLTFDDGPSPFTLDILDSLNTFSMKATFFMLEPNMRMHQKELHAIIDNGHIPALHGVTHNVSKIYRSEKTVVAEMAQAQSTLIKLTGTGTELIRTPYGSAPYMKPSYKKAVEEAGFKLWDWTVDSEDWKYRNGEYVNKVIQQIENFKYSDRPIVILLHDRKSTAEHLPKLLTYLKDNGYTTEVLNNGLTAFHF